MQAHLLNLLHILKKLVSDFEHFPRTRLRISTLTLFGVFCQNPIFWELFFGDPLHLKTFGVKKGQCCSAATLLSSATRQAFWRTTETSGRETVPGEMRRQRNTCGNQDRWWFKRFREGCAWLSAILSLTCMLHETGQKVSEPMLSPQWFPGCAIVLNGFLSAENAGFGRIQ